MGFSILITSQPTPRSGPLLATVIWDNLTEDTTLLEESQLLQAPTQLIVLVSLNNTPDVLLHCSNRDAIMTSSFCITTSEHTHLLPQLCFPYTSYFCDSMPGLGFFPYTASKPVAALRGKPQSNSSHLYMWQMRPTSKQCTNSNFSSIIIES